MSYEQIPPKVRAAIDRHVREGSEVGSFVYAVLCNDLQLAVGHADPDSLAALRECSTSTTRSRGGRGGAPRR